MKHSLVYCAAVIALLSCAAPSTAREWTDVTGAFRVEAEYVSSQDGVVKLKKADGSLIDVPLERLSTDDRQHVAELIQQAEKKAAEAVMPPWIDLPAPRQVLKYDREDALYMQFSPDGRFLACNSASKGIELWDLRNNRLARAFRHAHSGREVVFDFTPNGRTVVAARGNILMGWEVATGKQLFRDESLEAQPPITFSPDGKWIAMGGFDNNTGARFLQIVNAATRKRVQAIPMQQSPLGNGFVFSPDSKRLALGVNTAKRGSQRPNADGSFTFEPIAFLQVHAVPSLRLDAKSSPLKEGEGDMLNPVRFTDDGRHIVAYTHERLLFDANTGRRAPNVPSPAGSHEVFGQTELVAIWDAGVEPSHKRFVVWRPSDDTCVVRWNWPWPPVPEGWNGGTRSILTIDASGRQLAAMDRVAKEIRIYDLHPPGAKAADARPVPQQWFFNGQWEGADGHRFEFQLRLDVVESVATGEFLWKLASAPSGSPHSKRIGHGGTETVKGTFAPENRRFTLRGVRVSDPTLLATDQYDLLLSPDGQTISSDTDRAKLRGVLANGGD